MQQPVAVLRAYAEECGANTDGCVEKAELVQRIVAQERRMAGAASGATGSTSSTRGGAVAEDVQRDEALARQLQEVEVARSLRGQRWQGFARLGRGSGDGRSHNGRGGVGRITGSGAEHVGHLAANRSAGGQRRATTPPDGGRAVGFFSALAGVPAGARHGGGRAGPQLLLAGGPVDPEEAAILHAGSIRGAPVDLGSIHDRQARRQRHLQHMAHAERLAAQEQGAAPFDFGPPSRQPRPSWPTGAPQPPPPPPPMMPHEDLRMMAPPPPWRVERRRGVPGSLPPEVAQVAHVIHPAGASARHILWWWDALGSQPPQPPPIDPSVIEASTGRMTYAAPAEATNAHDAAASGSDERRQGDDVQQQQASCSVCLEAFKVGDELRILPCLHRYHCDCIDRWLQQSPACPVCKHQVAVH